jgi:hypothetical protein
MEEFTRQNECRRTARLAVLITLVGWCWAGMQAQTKGPMVEPIVSMRDEANSAPTADHGKRRKSFEVKVEQSGWVDSGEDVQAGEVWQAGATGTFALTDGRVTGPEGLGRGWKDLLRQFPLNGAQTGALIGRVSSSEASVPFFLGVDGKVTMPTSGRLFLAVNASDDLAGTGRYVVKLKLDETTPQGPRAVSAKTVGVLVSPETFEGVPRRVVDSLGNQGDMVNFSLIGTLEQVQAAFKAAGWVAVDASIQDAVLHGVLSTLGHEAYTAMPMSTLYLFGRAQDLSFARGDPLKVAAERHHLRVWKTQTEVNGAPLWVGSATHDIGFERDQRNGDVTHKIDPKVDDERDFLLKSFDAAGMFSSAAYVTPEGAVKTAKTATGGKFQSDGRMLVMALR